MILDKKFALEVLKHNYERIVNKFIEIDKEGDKEQTELRNMLDTHEKTKYIFSKTVIETLETIKINDKFDCNILKERKTFEGIIILSSTEIYLFREEKKKLRVFYYSLSLEKDYFDMNLFTFNFTENKKIIDDKIEEKVWKSFLQCIIYLDFLPTEIKYINPNETTGTRKTDKIINKTNDKFILVTKSWNQAYKSKPSVKFYSKPHWGIRWTGSGRTIPKVTFIKGAFKTLNKEAEKNTKV